MLNLTLAPLLGKLNYKVKVKFKEELYQLVFTDHATARMDARGISIQEVISIVETGKIKPKDKPTSFWVYKSFEGRRDNPICLSISLENPFLIVITTLIHWRPL